MLREAVLLCMGVQGRPRNGGGRPGGSLDNMIQNWQAVQSGGVEDSRMGIDRIEFESVEWTYSKDGSVVESGTIGNRMPYE
jgi:hypothetical protein